MIGPKSWVTISISNDDAGRILVYPDGILGGNSRPFDCERADTFEGMIASAERAIVRWKVSRHDGIIRRMALDIIDLTDQHVTCTDKLLRGRNYSISDITEYWERACDRAGEMAGCAPFKVEFVA
ncbi:MAG TPA: hypothetical protein PK677_11260 [Acidiphilium sp.]|nr:hypothetical protein [Acidiphilium sp.]